MREIPAPTRRNKPVSRSRNQICETTTAAVAKGPMGRRTLDSDTDIPMSIVVDPSTGQVRGILRDMPQEDRAARPSSRYRQSRRALQPRDSRSRGVGPVTARCASHPTRTPPTGRGPKTGTERRSRPRCADGLVDRSCARDTPEPSKVGARAAIGRQAPDRCTPGSPRGS